MAVTTRCGEPEAARADEHHVIGDALVRRSARYTSGKPRRNGSETWSREHQRRGAGAALAAVDGDEVGSGAAGAPSERPARTRTRVLADRRLDADRQPGRRGQRLDELDERCPRRRRRVWRLGRLAVDPDGDAADRGDLRRHLRSGQHPTETGLRPLGELDLDRPHRSAVDRRRASRSSENRPVVVTTAEVGGPDLQDQVPTVAVVLAETRPRRCCAGSRPAPHPRSGRLDRPTRQRAEAHGRDVHDRARVGTPRRRPWARPSTLAHGTANDGSVCSGSPGRFGSGNAECLTMR